MPLTRFHPLAIADRRAEADDAVSLSFAIPAALRDSFAFRPGQYLTLRATIDGEDTRRPYSICAGLDDGELRVAIRTLPGGRFSTHAATALAPGDTLQVMPPQGRFGLAPDPAAPPRLYLALAAGAGITPILAILKSLLAREPHSRIILLYGSRSTASILFRNELEDLKDRHLRRLTVVHTLSREEQDIAALSGRLDGAKLRALLPALADPAEIHQAFICGPTGMAEDLAATLATLGTPPARIQSEHFTPAPGATPRPAPRAPETQPAAHATIRHHGASRTIPVAPGETLLDAALRAGLDLPWSCHGGMCSTCRARLTEGEAEMALNFSLDHWETQAGFILTCQARPLTACVTVDYDAV